MLVTSRATRRFIVPKGWPMKGKSGRKAAMIEAQEEAGVVGNIVKEPAGAYSTGNDCRTALFAST
jgi:8-oxo-dGTP pyrophosphatase MutT (NUDIX family)